MRRLATGTKLVIASHNRGKVQEIADLLQPYQLDIIAAADLNLPEPEETGASFQANAELKACAAAAHSGHLALGDDSGLAVGALDGAPGIFSARWAGQPRDFSQACARVWQEIKAANLNNKTNKETNNMNAKFICVLALAWPDGHRMFFEGVVEGRIIWPPRGQNGFGYDPIFVAKGCAQSFGEMKPAQKHKISHRARAFALMKKACFAP